MTPDIFDRHVKEWLVRVEQTLCSKRGEYAPDADCVANFKRGAELLGKRPEEILLGYLTKHLVSVIDLVQNDRPATRHLQQEKIGDCLAYFILLDALWEEKAQTKVSPGATMLYPSGWSTKNIPSIRQSLQQEFQKAVEELKADSSIPCQS